MICEKMVGLVKGSSAIRAMFEEGRKMAKIYGEENVYDFSLGNPNVAPPKAVAEAVAREAMAQAVCSNPFSQVNFIVDPPQKISL